MYNECDSLTARHKITQMGWHAIKINWLLDYVLQCR